MSDPGQSWRDDAGKLLLRLAVGGSAERYGLEPDLPEIKAADQYCRGRGHPGLLQTRARTTQFAAGKNTPCGLAYF